jgi:hypothetical protein
MNQPFGCRARGRLLYQSMVRFADYGRVVIGDTIGADVDRSCQQTSVSLSAYPQLLETRFGIAELDPRQSSSRDRTIALVLLHLDSYTIAFNKRRIRTHWDDATAKNGTVDPTNCPLLDPHLLRMRPATLLLTCFNDVVNEKHVSKEWMPAISICQARGVPWLGRGMARRS